MKKILILAFALVALSMSLSADSLAVYVAYEDNLRASGFAPTPWIGDTFNGQTVISQTNPSGVVFDGGAIRIDNTGATTLVISDFQVSMNNGANVYAIWGAGTDLTIAPGQSGIFTQYPNSGENFDTSDVGLFGGTPPANLEPNNADGNGNTSLIGGCSSDPSFFTAGQLAGACNPDNAPVISFLENGIPVSVTDTGFVLDTGEWDFVNNSLYGEDGNESINWNLAGVPPSRGGSTPEPGSALLFSAGIGVLALVRHFAARRANR